MEPLTSRQRSYLRSLAHPLKPSAAVGKGGLTPQVIAAVNEALEAQELIKLRFLEHKEQKKELASQIEQECGCFCVGITGHVAVFYRQNEDAQKRRIELPPARQE